MPDLLFTVAFPEIADAHRRLIDEFRREHDPQAALVPPHFTLAFGCTDVAELDYLRHVESIARAVAPVRFHCRCALPGSDHAGTRAHVYLVPDEGHAAIALLHDRLHTGVLAGRRLPLPYTPHITIGSCSDFAQARDLCDELNLLGIDVAGTLPALTVGALRAGRFEPLQRFALARGATESAVGGAMDIEVGNAGDLDTRGTGWWIGFSDWTKDGGANLRHMPAQAAARGVSAKWYAHPAGHPNGEPKPISEGRSLSLLVGAPGEFRIDFSRDPAFPPDRSVSHVMRRPGDFIAWGPGLYHRSFGLRDSTILTLRWVPEDGANAG